MHAEINLIDMHIDAFHSSASIEGATIVTSDPLLIIQRDTSEYLAVCQAAPHTVKTSYLDWKYRNFRSGKLGRGNIGSRRRSYIFIIQTTTQEHREREREYTLRYDAPRT